MGWTCLKNYSVYDIYIAAYDYITSTDIRPQAKQYGRELVTFLSHSYVKTIREFEYKSVSKMSYL